MDKKTFIEKVMIELENQNVTNRKKFLKKSFVNTEDDTDCELTLTGAQVCVVIADIIGLKYTFYKVDEQYLSGNDRQNIINKIKEQYPGTIFFLCGDGSDDTPKTIDVGNNFVVFESDNFNTAIELFGDVNKFMSAMIA